MPDNFTDQDNVAFARRWSHLSPPDYLILKSLHKVYMGFAVCSEQNKRVESINCMRILAIIYSLSEVEATHQWGLDNKDSDTNPYVGFNHALVAEVHNLMNVISLPEVEFKVYPHKEDENEAHCNLEMLYEVGVTKSLLNEAKEAMCGLFESKYTPYMRPPANPHSPSSATSPSTASFPSVPTGAAGT